MKKPAESMEEIKLPIYYGQIKVEELKLCMFYKSNSMFTVETKIIIKNIDCFINYLYIFLNNFLIYLYSFKFFLL